VCSGSFFEVPHENFVEKFQCKVRREDILQPTKGGG
jgi:hypothetical protein